MEATLQTDSPPPRRDARTIGHPDVRNCQQEIIRRKERIQVLFRPVKSLEYSAGRLALT